MYMISQKKSYLKQTSGRCVAISQRIQKSNFSGYLFTTFLTNNVFNDQGCYPNTLVSVQNWTKIWTKNRMGGWV